MAARQTGVIWAEGDNQEVILEDGINSPQRSESGLPCGRGNGLPVEMTNGPG